MDCCLLPEIVEPLYGTQSLKSDIRESVKIIKTQKIYNKKEPTKQIKKQIKLLIYKYFFIL